MKREKYEPTTLELIRFHADDVILTSVEDYEGWNPHDPVPDSGEYEGWNPH